VLPPSDCQHHYYCTTAAGAMNVETDRAEAVERQVLSMSRPAEETNSQNTQRRHHCQQWQSDDLEASLSLSLSDEPQHLHSPVHLLLYITDDCTPHSTQIYFLHCVQVQQLSSQL